MFWYGFTVGCLAVIIAEISGMIVYAIKRGKKK